MTDRNLIRKANQQIEYEPKQVIEFKKCSEDPLYFIENYMKIQHPVKGAISFKLFPFQKEALRNFVKYQNNILLMSRQVGKAVDINEKIPTPTGWSTMGDLKVGDEVFGSDGKPTKISFVSDIMENRKCYEVKLSCGATIIADEEHLWAVKRKRKTHIDNVVLTTKQIKDEGVMFCGVRRFSIKTTKPLDLPDKDLPIDPYLLGVWLCKKENLYRDKHIPLKYLRASYNQRLSLLQGLMDTDGTISKDGKHEITISDEQLATGIFELICTLGLEPTKSIKKTTHKDSHRIRFSAFGSEREIINISPIKSRSVRCIQVDNEDSLFLVGEHFIPTHNTTTTAGFLLWLGSFEMDKTIMILSNKNSSAMEIVHRIKYAYEELPMWLKPGVTADGWNKHSVAFENGSRIISAATSEDAGRTFSISYLFLDEFAFVRESIQETFWTSISPTLSEGGRCTICSTPNGDSNLFAQLWRGAISGVNDFHPMNVTWKDHPSRDEDWARNEKGKIGKRKFKQEHETEFLSEDPVLISSLFLSQMKSIEPFDIRKDLKLYEDIKRNSVYIIAIDPATGTGNDFSVIEVFSFPELSQVGEFRSNTMSSANMYGVLKNIISYIDSRGNDIYWSVENNGVGEGIIALYENDDTPNANAQFCTQKDSKRLGFTTTNKTKLKACVDLKEMIENGSFKINSEILLTELKNFVRKGKSYEAKQGATDDCISACLVVTRILEYISEFEDEAFDLLYHNNKENNLFDVEEIDDSYYNENDPDHAPLPMAF